MTLTVSSFELPSLTELDTSDVQQTLELLATQLQELNPAIDLKRGVFKDTLAYWQAILQAAIRTNLERYQSARSLQQIAQDPTLADDTVVDEVLSNWGVVRKSGTKATGPVTIELSSPTSVTIPQGFTFEANGRSYYSVATFVSRTSSSQVSSTTDRLLVQLSNGNWAFTVTVEAEDIGADSKLNAGDLIVPNRSVAAYVTSYATSSFEDGTNTETNAQLIEELQLGIAAKALSNRTNMRAYLRSLEEYASVTNQSIVGYGDPEMLRDKHTIFPISFGGRVDWYVRGQESLQRMTYITQATCVAINGATSVWQFSLAKTAFPGFYEVSNIRRFVDSNLNSGFEILLDQRANDLTGVDFIPDLTSVAEGAYTAFQTATIQFADTVTSTLNLAVGATADYVCELTGTPWISNLQSLVSNRDIRFFGADALIKAPVPCFVQVNLTINKAAGDAAPNVDGIKSAIVAVINQTDFIGRLDGSRIVEAIHNYLQDNLSVTGLDLLGRIRNPDGTLQYLRDSDALVIVDRPDKMVTAKTVQFFSETTAVSVNVASTIPTAR